MATVELCGNHRKHMEKTYSIRKVEVGVKQGAEKKEKSELVSFPRSATPLSTFAVHVDHSPSDTLKGSLSI